MNVVSCCLHLLPDITSPESHPILRGRALWCAARLADAFQMDDLGYATQLANYLTLMFTSRPVLNRISEILNSSSEGIFTDYIESISHT